MRLRTLIGTAAAVTIAVLVAANPASAATADDFVTVDAPEKVSIGASVVGVPWTVRGTDYALANYFGTVGIGNAADFVPPAVTFAYAGHSTGRLWLEAKDVRPGAYKVDWFGGAFDLSVDTTADPTLDDSITANGDAIVVKWAGNAALSATRSGSVVTLTATARRFNTTGAWVAYPGAKLTFQRYLSGAWKTVSTTKTADSKGHAVLKVTDATARSYRVLQGETTIAWADYSSTVKK